MGNNGNGKGNCTRENPAIEVITGCMFSGKTEEMAARLKRLGYGRKQVRFQTFKTDTDNRAERSIVTLFPETISISCSRQLIEFANSHPEIPVLALDEAQFADEKLPEVVDILARKFHRRVIISGLNLDYRGRPFGPIPTLMAMTTDGPTLLMAVCENCGSNYAIRSQRVIRDRTLHLVGGRGLYEARCLNCFEPFTD